MIIGATSEQDADMLIDEPRVSGRHARIEIVPCDGGSKCNRDYRRVQCCSIASLTVNSAGLCMNTIPSTMMSIQTEHVLTYLVCEVSFNAGCC